MSGKHLITILVTALCFPAESSAGIVGDVNGDSLVSIADIATLIDHLQSQECEQGSHRFVDLGLTSGTLWASTNVGASTPEAYGSYFAWGETSEKELYYWSTYADSQSGTASDFTTYSAEGLTSCIGTNDDAAHTHWGCLWQLPTLTQCQELRSECTWASVNQNDTVGMLITGPNGNSIFMPKAGRKYGSQLMETGLNFYYWAGDLYCRYEADASSSLGSYMDASFNNYFEYYGYSRSVGFPVRPVFAFTTLQLNGDVNADGVLSLADIYALSSLLLVK